MKILNIDFQKHTYYYQNRVNSKYFTYIYIYIIIYLLDSLSPSQNLNIIKCFGFIQLIIKEMGQTQLKYSVTNLPNISEWENQKSIGYCELIRNKKTGEQMEKYKLLKKNMNIEEELQFYEYRKNQNANLVKILFVQEGHSPGICSGEDFYNVYSQRIPLRLSEVQNISFEQSLMVIRDSLVGFDMIKNSYEGCLKINDQMIGFTIQGRLKVWVNENFYINFPDQNKLLKGVSYESDPTVTVAQIFNTVQQHLQNKMFPNDFQKKLQGQETRLDYQMAKSFISNYAKQNNIYIPERLSLCKYISPFKRESLKIALPFNEPKRTTNVRSIKIIPQSLILSPQKQYNKFFTQKNINEPHQNLKVNFSSPVSQVSQNYFHNNSVKAYLSQQKKILNGCLPLSENICHHFNGKQIQRVNSQYIYSQEILTSPKLASISNSSRKHLQPFNVFYQTKQSEKNRMSQCLSEDADSLNNRIQRLTLNIQKQIQNSLVTTKFNKIGCPKRHEIQS